MSDKNEEGFSIKKLFTKKNKPSTKINVGDVGICKDLITYYNESSCSDAMKHVVFIKIEVIGVYHNMVEVKVLEVEVSKTIHTSIVELAKTNICKYMDTKSINWRINK